MASQEVESAVARALRDGVEQGLSGFLEGMERGSEERVPGLDVFFAFGRSERRAGRLVETLAAWLEHQGEIRPAAAQLHVHPQTVRYRVAQLRELLGDRMADAGGRLELELALRARRLGA
jgi:hypothetical protein